MTIALSSILADVLKKEGGLLNVAQKDLKTIRQNMRIARQVRNIVAAQLKELKAKQREADRKGGGKESSELSLLREYLRKLYTEMSEELVMVKLQNAECLGFMKQQQELVLSADAHWEKAKADEAGNATEAE
ncbi:UNVERIFIED_CONTAM: hypothetical protein RF648_18195 [Kocuria sp. CPCC 205274]